MGGRPKLWARSGGMCEADPIYGQGMRGCGRQAPSMGKVFFFFFFFFLSSFIYPGVSYRVSIAASFHLFSS